MLHLKNMFAAVVACTAFFTAAAVDSVIIFNPMQIDKKCPDSDLFNDIVSAELSCADGIKLVDRKQLDKLLHEKSMKPNGMLNADEVNNIGSLLGADYFVSGSVREKNNKLMVFIKSISVKTGVVKIRYISSASDYEAAAKNTAQKAVELIKSQLNLPETVNAQEQLLFPDKKRPTVAICVPEIHIASQRLIDPAAENELIKIFIKQKFNVKQLSLQLAVGSNGWLNNVVGSRTTMLKAAKEAEADYLIYGEAISESSGSFGNYLASRARVELKIISTSTNNIVWAESMYAGAADTAEIISGKKAIQKAAANLATKAVEALLK